MSIHLIDPIADKRWHEFAARHPSASVFHQPSWMLALARTYGYQPLAVTTAAMGEELKDGIPLCRVSSWITGTRLVSLPFADHCQPLLSESPDSAGLVAWLCDECDRHPGTYVELRPLLGEPRHGLQPGRSYYFHELDITLTLTKIFAGLHRDSIQRRIRRAEREALSYLSGRSSQILDEFYRLMLITRRRHHLPPQPREWFGNLVDCAGEKAQIRLATKGGVAIAGMLTLRHRAAVVYKYGCSDKTLHALGAMPFLFWRLIEESKAAGVEKLDFGRCDMNNTGLFTFKNRFGTQSKLLTYYCYPHRQTSAGFTRWGAQIARCVVPVLPDAALRTAGRILYRHIG